MTDTGRAGAMTAALIAALGRCGFSERDRRQLRFYFEAPTLRAAVRLARDLRALGPDGVHVRPSVPRLLTRRRWTVAFTTPAAPLCAGVIRLWESQMHDLAGARPGLRCVRCKPLLHLEDPTRPA